MANIETVETAEIEETVETTEKTKKASKPKIDFDKLIGFVESFLGGDVERTLERCDLRKELKADKENKKLQERLEDFQTWTDENWEQYDELSNAEQKVAYEISENVERLIDKLSNAKLSNDQIKEVLVCLGDVVAED